MRYYKLTVSSFVALIYFNTLSASNHEIQPVTGIVTTYLNYASKLAEHECLVITAAIKRVDPKEQENVVDNLLYLITLDMYGEQQAELIDVISSIFRQGKRNVVIKQSKRLITDAMNGYHRAGIVRYLQNIDDRDDVIDHTLTLLTDKMLGYSRLDVLKSIARTDKDDRREFVNNIKRFELDNESGLPYIMDAVERIRKYDQDYIITQSLLLLDKHMSGWDQSIVIDAVDDLADKRRKDVVALSFRYITPGMNGANRVRVINIIDRIIETDRDHVVDTAARLVKQEMSGDGYGWVYVLEFIAKTLKIDRDRFVETIQRFKLNNDSGLPYIIDAVERIHKDNQDDIITKALTLITPDMNGQDQSLVIDAVDSINRAKLEDVVEKAWRYITPNMSGDNRASVIKILEETIEDRAHVVGIAKRLVSQSMNGDERIQVLKIAKTVDRNDRNAFVNNFKELITYETTNSDRIAIMDELAKISADKRDVYVARRLSKPNPDDP